MWSKIFLGVGALMLLWAGWGQMNLGQVKQQKKLFDQAQQQGPFGRMPGNSQLKSPFAQAQKQGPLGRLPGNSQMKTQFDQQWKQAESGAQARIVFSGVVGMLMVAGGGITVASTKSEELPGKINSM